MCANVDSDFNCSKLEGSSDDGECGKLMDDLTLGASASDLNCRRGSAQQTLTAPDNSSFQLETDYIQRYLGKLTVLQESKLVQLRDCMTELQKGKVSL